MLTVFPGDFRVIHLYAQRLQASATGPELLQQAPGGERVAPVPFAPAPLLTVTSENTHREFPAILRIKSKLLRPPCPVSRDTTLTFISLVYSFTPVLHPALYPMASLTLPCASSCYSTLLTLPMCSSLSHLLPVQTLPVFQG